MLVLTWKLLKSNCMLFQTSLEPCWVLFLKSHLLSESDFHSVHVLFFLHISLLWTDKSDWICVPNICVLAGFNCHQWENILINLFCLFLFQMFVYTSAKKEYAEKIVDILDPNKKLFRWDILHFESHMPKVVLEMVPRQYLETCLITHNKLYLEGSMRM